MPNPKLGGVSRGAAIGGCVATAVALSALYLTGQVTGAEARYQLEATQPTVRFLSSTIVTVAATVLALMVTALSVTKSEDHNPDEMHFARLKVIAILCTIALIGGITMLMLLTVPFGESLEVAGQTYATFYYIVIGGSALLGGVVVTIVLMLYNSLTGMIAMVRPDLEQDPDE